MHGNAVAALACHLEFILPTNFTNVYRCAIGFSPTDYTDFIDFLFSLYDSLFCFAKIALWIYTDFIAARWFFAHKFHKYHEYLSLRDGFSRYSRGARTLRCSRFCCLAFFSRSFIFHGTHRIHGFFLF